MKALCLYDKQDLRFEDAKAPALEHDDDVIIKVKAVGVCGSDLSRYAKLGPYIPGVVFGHEFAGVVVKTGAAVTGITTGDRVAGCPALYCGKCISCQKGAYSQCESLTVLGAKHPGAYAEYTKLPAENVIKLPDSVDFDSAAMIEPSAVVLHGLYKTAIQPGSTVAVIGCGSIGLLAVQWAKLFGAKMIVAIDIDDSKLELAQALGADMIINSQNVVAHEYLFTHSNGVDLAVEAAGSPITSAQVFALCKKGGQVLYLGIPYGNVSIERFYFEKVVRNELEIIGSWNALSAPFPGKEWHTTVHHLANGSLNILPIISHRLSLKQGPWLFNEITQNKQSMGKVIFYPELDS
ncbi:L-iditol 2-dehydrogenase [Amphibacillus marinus]|uniref:L-iditol 2-dehydrogenase n=1 Tax=Amphibacillus marinus TaxID=872970 RepID=A0A1H8PH11_9BACI|nr:galactitol-1-phosphate 5-dehydrogenase [Amphibacillus marinus]SEO41220.1 L-iditol 2-dehydrogenase [Amphibacillus marinus]